jgi:tryptophan-rich sensory protein
MSPGYALLTAIIGCVTAAILEGICAGGNVRPFYRTLHFPRYSAPLWVWSIIGGLYYLIFCFLIYRLLRLGFDSAVKSFALVLIVFMMLVNALTNYVIFRAQNLWVSFLIGSVFPVLDITLFVLVLFLDAIAALSLVPYLIYRVYAVWWGYALWKIN